MPGIEPRLTAIVPLFNERATVSELCRRLAQVRLVRQVILVDDGSTDGTREQVLDLCARHGFQSVLHRHNRGKGAALRSGLVRATHDYVIIQDGDLEYDPGDIRDLAAALSDGVRAVYGSRFLGTGCGSMRWLNRRCNIALTGMFNKIYGRNLSDVETGYKLISTSLLRQLGVESDGFEVDQEISAKLARCGEAIAERAISYRGRGFRDGKKIGAKDALAAVRTMWRFRRWQPPPRLPLAASRTTPAATGTYG